MKEHLQPWYDRWLADHKSTDLLYVSRDHRGEPYLEQVHFVRDNLASIVWADAPYADRKPALPRENKETAFVIGGHTSKSVWLPVYSLERPDLGVQFVLRDNFHDWNISVISEKPIKTDLRGFQLDNINYCFFQGFPADVQFGPFNEDPCRFSICIGSDHDVYTFIWLLMRDLRAK